MKNLFDTYPFTDPTSEQFETLLENDFELPGGFRLERILSFGRTTPEGEWYQQEWSEWVAVIRGLATLTYDDGTTVTLRPGDHLIIRPKVRHRVSYTSDDCFWLAFHYRG